MSGMPNDLGTLNSGEKFLFQVRPAARALLPYFLVTTTLASTIIFLPIAMLMGIGLFLLYFYSFRSVRYFVTTDRVILLRRLVSTDRRDMYFSSIRDLEVYQGLGGRIFGYGTIQPNFSDSESSSVPDLGPDDSIQALQSLSHISNPKELLPKLQNLAQSKQKRQTFE